MTVEPVPDWIFPDGGFTAEDLDHLPDLPRHTELIDGGLVFLSPQREFHWALIHFLTGALASLAAPRWRTLSDMSVVLNERQRLQPDVLLVRASAVGTGGTWYAAEDVLLVVEVVSPDSMVRDRERKPQLYAQAGIQHFWRIDEVDGQPVVYVYELDPTSASYAISGIHHKRLKIDVPFPINLDLTHAAEI